MKKTDVHVHCAPQRLELAFGDPNDPAGNYVCDPAELLETMAAHDIDRAVLMSTGETLGTGPFGLGAANADCRQICSRAPGQLYWMCNLDPHDPQTVYERLAACKAQGAVGVGEVMANEWMDSPFLSALFAAAEKLDLPVTCHMSPEPGISYGVCDRQGLPLLEQTLQKHPDLAFLGHSQVFWLEISALPPQLDAAARRGYGHGPVQPGGTLERLFAAYPNLYGDLSAYSAYCAVTRDEEYGLAFLERFQDRLLFATDATNRRSVPPLGRFLDDAAAAGRLSRSVYEKICKTNAEHLFHLA